MAIKNQEVIGMQMMSNEVTRKLDKYFEGTPEQKSALYATECMVNEMYKAKLAELEQDVKELDLTLSFAETSPNAWKTIIKPYFAEFGITNGACVAVGQYMSSFKKFILATNPEGLAYFLNTGRHVHLFNYVMGKIEKSSSPFFVDLRRNATAYSDFSNCMLEYCKVMFFREMNVAAEEYGR